MVSEMAIGPLPADIQQKLAALATQYPDQITFDAGSGMLRFNSDLTFSSGKDVVKPEAAQTLAKLAAILDSDSATSFELVVVGHTDDVQPKYSKNQHPTNRHLAVHRAIAVCNELVLSGVANDRVQVAGWGEHRPLIANETGGTPMNRRVEIYLAATKDTNPMPMATSTTTTATVDTDEPMK